MKKLFLLTVLLSGLCLILKAQNSNPKLVVGIVVDQMRNEYLYRYYDKFGNDGFKRLLNEGFHYKNAHYNYIPTFTGPGHASIYTGTTPSRHGIIANNWYSKVLNRSVYCAEDTAISAVGGTAKNGKISALNLKTTTITDELRTFYNDQSKVVGIALKDRGAAIPAGHHPNGAFWYDDVTGEFMSSKYYMNELPEWAKSFNAKGLAKKYAAQTWTTLYPIAQYVESIEDNSPYENKFGDQKTSTFPYKLSKEKSLSQFRTTPFSNTFTLDFALAAIEGEKMGNDAIVDFLALSFSGPDNTGHAFGPRSVEVEDVYIRLDLEIARLLKYLDEKIGKEDYLIFLTADHAVADVPQYLIDRKLPGGYLDMANSGAILMDRIAAELGPGEWIQDVSNDQLFLNHQLIKDKGLKLHEVQDVIAKLLIENPAVAEAIPAHLMLNRPINDAFYARLQNGYHSQLSGDILIMLHSGYLYNSYGNTGTTHGSGYTYDTHVPILFFGKNIPAGNSVRKVSITDIAPSISMLLNITLPSASTGDPLIELFEKID